MIPQSTLKCIKQHCVLKLKPKYPLVEEENDWNNFYPPASEASEQSELA